MSVSKEEYIHRIGIKPSDTISGLYKTIEKLKQEIEELKKELENKNANM